MDAQADEQVIAVAELQASNARFQNVVNSSPDGVVVTSTDAVIRFVNPAAMLMFGLSQKKLLGKPFHYSDLTGSSVEIEILQPDRAPIIAEMRVVQIEWDGQPAMLATLRDISERIQLTKDLLRSNQDLEEFASVLSHDIRAPLRNLNLLSGWLQKDHSADLNSDALEDVEMIRTTTARMQRMVDDLLHYSRVSARQKKAPNVDLNEILEDVKAALSEDIFRTAATIQNAVLPVIDCNIAQMTTLFQNLIQNSLQYCSERPEIMINAEQHDHSWLLSFADNGVGVPENSWSKVFKPFNHLQSDGDKQGAGIGLATCKKIVGTHNGKIWLESIQDHGSTVYVSLPGKSITIPIESTTKSYPDEL